jgi:hypothetical protein
MWGVSLLQVHLAVGADEDELDESVASILRSIEVVDHNDLHSAIAEARERLLQMHEERRAELERERSEMRGGGPAVAAAGARSTRGGGGGGVGGGGVGVGGPGQRRTLSDVAAFPSDDCDDFSEGDGDDHGDNDDNNEDDDDDDDDDGGGGGGGYGDDGNSNDDDDGQYSGSDDDEGLVDEHVPSILEELANSETGTYPIQHTRCLYVSVLYWSLCL